jgi:hypothetical protein
MMHKFRAGDVILLDGLYGCDACDVTAWGVPGRRFPRPGCGHQGEWKLIRRRVDHGF